MRKGSTRSILSSLICIAGGVLVGFVILLLLAAFTESIPFFDAFTGLFIILGGPFAAGNGADVLFQLGDMLLESTPLLMTGLSVAIAFKTGLFNIGAPGQYLMGAMGSLLVALSIPTTPGTAFFVWLLALAVGILCGMIWGAIPGLFKALFKVNEVIVCIMTNWIAANIVSWVFYSTGERYINIAETKTKFIRKTITNGVMTPKFGLDKLFPGSHIDISLLIAILIAIGVYILINKTTLGYELKACGFNKDASRYAGMNEKRNIILSMIIAGGLAACGASLWFLNGQNDFLWNTYLSLPNDGFNGIPVALLASNNPLGVIFSSIFLRYIGKGGFNLSGYTAFNEYVSNLIIAMIIYFAGFSKLLIEVITKRQDKKNEARLAAQSAAAARESMTEREQMPDSPKTTEGGEN
ncbi:MAG: ABC transporter permease [Ruminococcus sp.]|nr:ABC transporter permease [Candidatus Apopatosoma intestinale]